MTRSQEAQIRRAFAGPPGKLTEEVRDICDALAYAHRMLALKVAEVCATSRETNKSLGHLEESLDYATKAVLYYHGSAMKPIDGSDE